MKKKSIAAQVITFSFNGKQVRVIVDKKGNHFFVGRDICHVLNYKNPNVIMRDRRKSGIAKYEIIKDRMGRDSEVRVLTLDEAVEINQRSVRPVDGFENWLISEVTPALNVRLSQQKTREN